MKVVSRSELGYSDEFEGFIFFKEQEPAAQLHLYDNFYTLFWRGRGSVEALGESLGCAVEEICGKAGYPFGRMNKGVAQYALAGEVKCVAFDLSRDRWRRMKVRFAAGSPQDALGGGQPLSFIRFDIEGDPDTPVILWSDLEAAEDAEVGFSTNVELPPSVLKLMQRTCRIELTGPDLEELEQLVKELILIKAEV